MKSKKIDELDAITILLFVANLFLYEIGFCNLKTIVENGSYNFSLFRIIVYTTIIVLYIIFYKKISEEAKRILPKKKKTIITYMVIILLCDIYLYFKIQHIYQFILITMAEINGLLFLLYVSKDYVKNIIITAMAAGSIFSIATDAFHNIDEKKHFVSALNVSVGNFNYINEALTDTTFNNIQFNTPMIDVAMEYFDKKCDFNLERIPQDESIFSTPANYNFIVYLPSSIGMCLARFLGGSFADVFIAGRMASILVYTIMLIIMFKLLPFKKNLFYVIYMMPMVLTLASSYSADTMTLGFVGIFIAYIFKISKEEINLKKFLIAVVLYAPILLCKGGSYFGIITLGLMLPIIKLFKQNKKILFATIIIVAIALTVGLTQGKQLFNNPDGDDRIEEASPLQQVNYLKENPTHIVKVYGYFIKLNILNIEWYQRLNIADFYGINSIPIGAILIIYIICVAITDISYTFKLKEKIVLIFTYSVVVIITISVLYFAYSKVGDIIINGYQARYIIPILPLLLGCINSTKISIKPDEKGYSDIAIVSGMLALADMLSMIITL